MSLPLPFIEKHRPRNLKDVVGNSATVTRLQYFVDNGNLPNLLLTSNPGQGKTTIVGCLATQMLGDQKQQAFLELNASDERNVTDIRERVKTFAQKQVTLPAGRHKMVFLDECDSMTAQAQLALRRVLEDYSDSTRFLLACNQINKIVEPLQSRCCVITLGTVTAEEIVARLKVICQVESIEYQEAALKQIAVLAEGDVRSAVNSLEAAAVQLEGKVRLEGLQKALDFVTSQQIGEIIKLLEKQELDRAIDALAAILEDGFQLEEVVSAFYRYFLDEKLQIADVRRSRALKAVAAAHVRVSQGVASPVQGSMLLVELMEACVA